MPVSNLVKLGTATPTNQQLADLALIEDQRARRASDLVVRADAAAERDALCELMR